MTTTTRAVAPSGVDPARGPATSARQFRLGPVTLLVRARGAVTATLLSATLLALCVYALTLGELRFSVGEVLGVVADPASDPLARYFLLEVRPPRVAAAAGVGAALGLAGALSQTVTGNPLGSPDVLGFTTGAATGAVVAIVVFGADVVTAGPVAAAGALATLLLVVGLARRREDGVAMSRLVLVGVGVGAGLAGLNRFLIARAPVREGLAASLWEAGSFNGVLWPRLLVPALACAVVAACCPALVRGLSVLVLGDDTARSLGSDPARVRVTAMILSVLLVAAATAVAGPVAFVAMAAPHAVRLLSGGDRPGLVVSTLAGAVTVVAADVLGRVLLPGRELPAGLVTGVLGGVYLVVLLARSWRRGTL